ncbi:Arv1 domain-containing protein, partial [Cephalotus follicularis]
RMDYRCMQCRFAVKTLFVQYSPGNIHLIKCENCKSIADEYIECEFMILLIDLILHKPKAYRHLLYNVLHQDTLNVEVNIVFYYLILLWILICPLAIQDKFLLLQRNEEEWGSSVKYASSVWICQKMLMDVFFGNFLFFCMFSLSTKNLLNTSVGVSK